MVSRDPKQTFDFIAKGRPYFLISDTRSFREPLTEFASRKGITDGKITREQFKSFNDEMQAKVAKGENPFASGGPPSGFGKGGPGGAPSPEDLKQMAKDSFSRRDRNGDGKLNLDEMNDSLKQDMAKYDRSRDGLIDVEEYEEYLKERIQGRMAEQAKTTESQPPAANSPPASPNTVVVDLSELDRKPTIYRAGNLPKEMPSWFSELDADRDGQVALYEWFRAQKPLEEFKQWDSNDDALITIGEVMRKMQISATTTNSGTSQAVTMFSPGGNGFNRPFGFPGGGGGGGERPSFFTPPQNGGGGGNSFFERMRKGGFDKKGGFGKRGEN